MYTIKDLNEGNCAVINDGTLEELEIVLKMAFPKDYFSFISRKAMCKYYFKYYGGMKYWTSDNVTSLPAQSVKDFLTVPEKWYVKPETEVEATVLAKYFDDNKLGMKGVRYLGIVYKVLSCGLSNNGYGLYRNSGHQEIPFKLFELKILNKEEMNYTITAKEMKELYEVVNYCPEWRNKIFNLYGRQMLDNQVCIVKQDLLDQARKEANEAQLCLINETFKPKYKEGDWVIFTKDFGENMGTIFEKGAIKQIRIDMSGSLFIDRRSVYGCRNLTDYFKLATNEEVERSQIKEGDLVWVKDLHHVNWSIRIARGEFSGENIKTYDPTGGHQLWNQYKKASQSVVDEYKKLQ